MSLSFPEYPRAWWEDHEKCTPVLEGLLLSDSFRFVSCQNHCDFDLLPDVFDTAKVAVNRIRLKQ